MKVKELMEELKGYPEDTEVMFDDTKGLMEARSANLVKDAYGVSPPLVVISPYPRKSR
jgi:hypothetical protein